ESFCSSRRDLRPVFASYLRDQRLPARLPARAPAVRPNLSLGEMACHPFLRNQINGREVPPPRDTSHTLVGHDGSGPPSGASSSSSSTRRAGAPGITTLERPP